MGPAIEDGFYYDVKLDRALSPDDFAAIEARMAEIVKMCIRDRCFALINAVIWIRARRKGSVSQPSRSVHPVVLFLLFALMFFSIVTFSWWWSTAVVGGDTVSASLASRGLNRCV